MREIVKTIKAFPYSELSDKAKEFARTEYAETRNPDWHIMCVECIKEMGSLIGFEIDNLYFSGFASQGDGACFEGRVAYKKGSLALVKKEYPTNEVFVRIAQQWVTLQRNYMYGITARVYQSGHYMHSGCTRIEILSDHQYRANFDDMAVLAVCREFMDMAYKMLEEEADYLDAEPAFIEACDANEWEFTESGKMI